MRNVYNNFIRVKWWPLPCKYKLFTVCRNTHLARCNYSDQSVYTFSLHSAISGNQLARFWKRGRSTAWWRHNRITGRRRPPLKPAVLWAEEGDCRRRNTVSIILMTGVEIVTFGTVEYRYLSMFWYIHVPVFVLLRLTLINNNNTSIKKGI